MAYKNLLNVTCADKAEVFARFRDFICKRNGTYDYSTAGIGWTLFDSSYAVDEDNPQSGDWFVMHSVGEDGDDDLYIWFGWASNVFWLILYQSWDPTAHAGSTNKANTAYNLTCLEAFSSYPIWVYGDLDCVCPMLQSGAVDWRMCILGKLQPVYNDVTGEVATCSTTLTAGSDVSIVVDAVPTHWKEDMEVFIRTTHTDAMGTVKMEKITITGIAGTTITADLVNNYTTGNKLTDFIGIVAQDSSTPFSTSKCLINPAGTINQTVTQSYNYTVFPTTTYDPESFNAKIGIYPIYWVTTSGAIGYLNWYCRSPTPNAFFTLGDTLEELDGTTWRSWRVYNVTYLAMKEV